MENGLIFFISTITSHFYPRTAFVFEHGREWGGGDRKRELEKERGRKEGTEGESFNSL